jgi:exosortase/archaeosortase family protein
VSSAVITACAPVHLRARDWLALQALALWPHGAYLIERALDGSDDPLGLVALATAAVLVAWHADTLRLVPNLGWQLAAIAGTLAANAAWLLGVPALAAGMIAALALGAAVAAWWPDERARLPLMGLLLLALPLVATAQFYVGYPLRLVTAEASAWILQTLGIDAVRSGTSMWVDGQLVIVDAACSGVQMAWWGYFTACATAAATRLGDAATARRLPLVGLVVLGANVLRNSVLVALEARPEGLPAAAHEAIGAGVLALVMIGAAALMRRRPGEAA